tara:strand:+ start:427 stop:2052 length:1626 start_codon:yes stop_codon:yes gene_type:complete
MKIQFLSILFALSSAQQLDCLQVQTIYEDAICCANSLEKTCAHKLAVSDNFDLSDGLLSIKQSVPLVVDGVDTNSVDFSGDFKICSGSSNCLHGNPIENGKHGIQFLHHGSMGDRLYFHNMDHIIVNRGNLQLNDGDMVVSKGNIAMGDGEIRFGGDSELSIGHGSSSLLRMSKGTGGTRNIEISADVSLFAVRTSSDFLQEVQFRKQVDFLKSTVFGTCNVYDSPSDQTSLFGIYGATPEPVTCHLPNTGSAVSYPFIFNRHTMFTDHVNMQSLSTHRRLTANGDLHATKGVTFNDGVQTKAFKAGAVTGTEIASNAVGNAHIAANIDASKITSGTLHVDRIPSITSAKLSYQSGIYFNNNFRITQWNYGDSSFPSGHSGIEFFKHNDMGRRLNIIGFNSVHIDNAPLYANGIMVVSDRRIKKNIVTIPDNLALETFRGLDAKYYNYKEGQGRSTEKTLGFIAQEVAEAIPEAVIIGNGTLPDGTKVDDFHYLNKDKVFTVAYAALQEVDKNQQKHAATIATLESTIADLTQRLVALESN